MRKLFSMQLRRKVVGEAGRLCAFPPLLPLCVKFGLDDVAGCHCKNVLCAKDKRNGILGRNLGDDLRRAREVQQNVMAAKAVNPKGALEKAANETNSLKVEIAADKKNLCNVVAVLDTAMAILHKHRCNDCNVCVRYE